MFPKSPLIMAVRDSSFRPTFYKYVSKFNSNNLSTIFVGVDINRIFATDKLSETYNEMSVMSGASLSGNRHEFESMSAHDKASLWGVMALGDALSKYADAMPYDKSYAQVIDSFSDVYSRLYPRGPEPSQELIKESLALVQDVILTQPSPRRDPLKPKTRAFVDRFKYPDNSDTQSEESETIVEYTKNTLKKAEKISDEVKSDLEVANKHHLIKNPDIESTADEIVKRIKFKQEIRDHVKNDINTAHQMVDNAVTDASVSIIKHEVESDSNPETTSEDVDKAVAISSEIVSGIKHAKDVAHDIESRVKDDAREELALRLEQFDNIDENDKGPQLGD